MDDGAGSALETAVGAAVATTAGTEVVSGVGLGVAVWRSTTVWAAGVEPVKAVRIALRYAYPNAEKIKSKMMSGKARMNL